MIKLVYCITKKPGITDEEFFHYWQHIHGPIGAQIPGLRRLIQSHSIKSITGLKQPDFDGMAELWFDSLEMLLAARNSIEWQLSTADENNFIDHNKIAFFITEEREIKISHEGHEGRIESTKL